MKRIFLILLSVVSLQFVNGQNCFEKLADFSGSDHSSSLAEIESAACELKNLLPTQFQDQFKVYDGNFYLHTGSFNEFGYPEAFDKLKNDIQSPYYLLVAAQNEPNKGLYSKFWVDVKLPDITGDGCIPNLNEEASNLVEFVIGKEFISSGRSPFSYPNSLIEGINSLKSYVEAATTCCQTGGDVAQCIDCNNTDNIAARLLALGFVAEPIQNIGDFDTGSDAIPEITDYANELFTVNNLTAVNISASYIEHIPIYQAQGLSIKIYITKDENVCSGEWQTIENEIENDPADVIFWHHIHKGEAGLEDELLFSRVFLNGEGSNIRTKGLRLQQRMLGPDPVTAIIGPLGSAFSDAMIQATIIYFVDDEIEFGEFGEVWSKVNYGSVAWSGFVGLFVVSSKAILVAKAVGAATAEVTYLAFTDDNYSMEQGVSDFIRVFVSDIIGNVVGNALGNRLRQVDINYLSIKAYGKLGKLVGKPIGKLRGIRFKVDPSFKNADEAAGVLVNGSYLKNPTATKVDELVVNPSGTVKFDGTNPHLSGQLNGKYMYVIDDLDQITIGTRASNVPDFPDKAPHPTLIGGVDPPVTAAGIIEFRAGKIYKVDNASGHYKPDSGSMKYVKFIMESFFNPKSFSNDFVGFKLFNN